MIRLPAQERTFLYQLIVNTTNKIYYLFRDNQACRRTVRIACRYCYLFLNSSILYTLCVLDLRDTRRDVQRCRREFKKSTEWSLTWSQLLRNYQDSPRSNHSIQIRSYYTGVCISTPKQKGVF